ncbi:fish-egg lectin-like [Xiphophorus maculatus]|uniref:fish-egg lectin-like n=1 Tax=Xiphophorus maculatus TaxID=8083 RepID=UPI0003B3998E|nr:fish-egg lectin-like [Xiphophorus maculatus]
MEGTYGNLDPNEPVYKTPTCKNRGSSSSKKRLYLEVIIFLGILNVVLLAGLIALGVYSRYLAAHLSDIKHSLTEDTNDKLSAALKANLTEMVKELQSSGGWTCSAAPQQFPAAQIDAGQGMVVMTDKNSNAFFLSGSSWSKLGSVPLKHVSVGPPGIWGVDRQNEVYKFVATDFVPTRGLELKQVDAGGQGQIVGVTISDSIHCLNANRASSIKELMNWNTMSGLLIYYSCAPTGCWGVNSEEQIYFMQMSNSCNEPVWNRIGGAAISVEVGSDRNVFVVNRDGQLFERTGISGQVPQGTGWKKIEMSVKIKHASYDLGYLWLVSETGFIVKCTK